MWSFTHPWLLLLLPIAVLVGWWSLCVRRPSVRSALVAAWTSLPRGRAGWAARLQAILATLAVSCWIIAWANPRQPDLRTKLPAEGIGIVLALDVSGSMATADFVPGEGGEPISRMESAKQSVAAFIVGRPNDSIGLVTFASVPVTVCPLTHNHTVLLEIVRSLTPAGALNAETDIGDALAEGCIRLETAGRDRRKVLVLLSDGEHNKVGENVTVPQTAAALAAKLQIPVYTIDCGGDPTGDESSIRQRSDGRAVLEAVSLETGGQAFTANNGDELRKAFQTIDTLERRPEETNLYRRYREYRGELLGAGLGFLGLSGFLNRTRWRRRP